MGETISKLPRSRYKAENNPWRDNRVYPEIKTRSTAEVSKGNFTVKHTMVFNTNPRDASESFLTTDHFVVMKAICNSSILVKCLH